MRRVNKMQALRTFLLAALLTASLSCSTVFYSAKASGGQDTVSKSDAVTGSDMIIETIMEDVGSKRLLFKKNAVYNGSFRSELFEDELLIYDALYEQCITNRSNASVEIDFSGLGYTSDDSDCIRDMMKSAFFAFAYDHPEVYWIRSFSSSQWKSGGYITKLQITPTEAYPNAFDDIDVVYSGITAAVNEINSTRASASRYDTAKAIHDYICHHASYDYDVLSGGAYAGDHAEDQTVAPLFGGGRRGSKFVCEGYSESFKLLCDRFNVPCVHLLSENHAWNYVQMEDGNWYAVDVTWDDYDMSDANGNPYIMYDYLFIKREEITAIEGHDIFSGDPYITYVEEEIPYNYYAHEGYLLDVYDKDRIIQIFLSQFEAGSNCLRIRFSNKDAYEQAKNWISDDPSELYDILSSIGYHGSFYRWNNDDLNTYTIGLYPPE